jgi:hypothetical protein
MVDDPPCVTCAHNNKSDAWCAENCDDENVLGAIRVLGGMFKIDAKEKVQRRNTARNCKNEA